MPLSLRAMSRSEERRTIWQMLTRGRPSARSLMAVGRKKVPKVARPSARSREGGLLGPPRRMVMSTPRAR
jgi:hypothetical protein